MKEDIVIAIRTCNRINTIGEHTLSLVKDLGIPIYIFCPEQEKAAYLKLYKGKYRVISGSDTGLNEVNNKIHKYFNINQKIVIMDDDIEGVNKWNGEKFEPADLKYYIEEGFRLCDENNFKLFGFYPVKNGFFMKSQPEYSKGLQFCMGGITGIINDRELKTTTYKEDYERCIINYLKYGGIIRFNYVKVDNILYKNSGGNSTIRTPEIIIEANNELKKKYPLYCRGKKTKSKYDEISLINKPYNLEFHLRKQLEIITWSKNCDRPNVSGLDEVKTKRKEDPVGNPCYSYTFGLFRPRRAVKGTLVLTKVSERKPLIYKLAAEYGKQISPDHEFTTITINRDIVCLPHIDKYNVNNSMIVSMGDYTEGGNLYIVIDKKEHKINTKNQPYIFNGRNLHWNDKANGRRFSFVYYKL